MIFDGVRTIALVEDDPVLGPSLVQRFAVEGLTTQWWPSGDEALAGFARHRPSVVICDIRLPDIDGETLFAKSAQLLGGVPFLFITGYGDLEQAVRLVRAGAVDYIAKPFAVDELVDKVRALLASELPPGERRLGASPQMQRIEALLRRIAAIDSHVLFLGESGVGKEVCARFLHAHSPRAQAPFVAVNCAAIPPELVESELFGHEKGAFTGAHGRHIGYVERAAGGFLFLDEIGDLPPAAQAKLLRLVQDRTFFRVGGEQPLPFAARLVCATNRNLEADVRSGRFREDLYYRINVIPVTIPPLRERPEDILPLLHRYLREFAEKFASPARGLTTAAEEFALEWPWPGNVRELVNRIERAVALADTAQIGLEDLFPEHAAAVAAATRAGPLATLSEARDAAEKRHIERALARTGGRMSETARILGISRTTLWEKMRRYGIAEPQSPAGPSRH
jgi:DNA-binding NtrC family response regulator